MEATGLAPEETGLGFFFLAMYGGGGDRRRQRRRMRAKDRLRSFALGRERKILCKCFLPLGLMVLLLVIRDNQENRLLTLNTQQGPYPLKKKIQELKDMSSNFCWFGCLGRLSVSGTRRGRRNLGDTVTVKLRHNAVKSGWLQSQRKWQPRPRQYISYGCIDALF